MAYPFDPLHIGNFLAFLADFYHHDGDNLQRMNL